MLQFNSKQLAGVGQAHLRQSLESFLRRHVPHLSQMPPTPFRAALDKLLLDCRARGLHSQRAIASYALASCTLGSAAVTQNPTLQGILANRQLPQAHKSLLIQTWLARTGAALSAAPRS